jgi:hypothetical protein
MKRTILALAIAGLSVAAYALPPPGGGPPSGTLDVNIISPSPLPVTATSPIPVTLTPARTPPGGLVVLSAAGWLARSTFETPHVLDPGGVTILTGFTLDVDASLSDDMTTEGSCSARLEIGNSTDGFRKIGLSTVVAGARDGRYVPLPNIVVPDGAELRTMTNNGTNNSCYFNATFYLLVDPE